jgi:hypothetical protein
MFSSHSNYLAFKDEYTLKSYDSDHGQTSLSLSSFILNCGGVGWDAEGWMVSKVPSLNA